MAAKIGVYDQDMTGHLLVAAYRLLDAPELEKSDYNTVPMLSQKDTATANLARAIATWFSGSVPSDQQELFDNISMMEIICGGKSRHAK